MLEHPKPESTGGFHRQDGSPCSISDLIEGGGGDGLAGSGLYSVQRLDGTEEADEVEGSTSSSSGLLMLMVSLLLCFDEEGWLLLLLELLLLDRLL